MCVAWIPFDLVGLAASRSVLDDSNR